MSRAHLQEAWRAAFHQRGLQCMAANLIGVSSRALEDEWAGVGQAVLAHCQNLLDFVLIFVDFVDFVVVGQAVLAHCKRGAVASHCAPAPTLDLNTATSPPYRWRNYLTIPKKNYLTNPKK